MALIPEEIVSQVIDRSDIVEIISGYTPLKKAGRNFKANCPFHHEKTPSFVVNPDKQIYHCFGCGVGGNVVGFVMKQERLEFPEAIRFLAERVNVIIPQSAYETKAYDLKDDLIKINELAREYFHNNLLSDKSAAGNKARSYLENRGISVETVKAFQLGLALEEWDGLFKFLKSKDISIQLIEKAGLIIARDDKKGYYDRFRNRIVFPILDSKGKCRAFGARIMDDKDAKAGAKYINSPETNVYTKGHYLYGFHLAKEVIGQKDYALVVEGYIDCIMPYQEGVQNIVASLGTALTTEQIRFLHRYTKNIIFLYDADAAGEAAMLRSLDKLLEEGMDVKIARLTENEDPDSFIKKFGIKAFDKCILTAQTLFDYKLDKLLKLYDVRTLEGKAKISSDMLQTISKFSHEILKAGYVTKLSQVLFVSEAALTAELKKIQQQPGPRETQAIENMIEPKAQSPRRVVEWHILKLLIEEESLIPLTKEDVSLQDFQDKNIREAISRMFDLFEQGKSIRDLVGHIEDQSMRHLITSAIADESFVINDKQKMYQDCVLRIKQERTRNERQHILHEMRQAEMSGDQTKLEELTKKFNQSVRR
jgi:DNA primase